MRKTQAIYDFVAEVLQSLPEPYTEDVTEDVCLAIEQEAAWLRTYEELVGLFDPTVVNSSIGRYVSEIVGWPSIRQVEAKRSSIIKSYSKLARS